MQATMVRGGTMARKIAWTPKRGWPRFRRERLRELFEEAAKRDPRWTVASIANYAELSHSTVYQYLREKRKDGKPSPEPTIMGMVRITLVLTEALGRKVEVDEFYG